MSERDLHGAERQVASAWLGTTLGTILPAVPPQMSTEILHVRYAMPAAQGTVIAFLVQSPDAKFAGGPFSSAGTVAATIDAAALDTNYPVTGEFPASDVFLTVDPGFALTGFTNAGSVLARVTYLAKYGRH